MSILKENFKYSTFILASITILVFILQNILNNFTEKFELIGKDVFSRPWILLTNIFLHSSISHLALNLFSLILIGIVLENFIGTKRFLLVYFISGTIASITSSFFL